jgi:hypothetical protein
MITKFWSENLKVRDHMEDLCVDRRIMLEYILENRLGGCGLDSSDSVNTVMNLEIPWWGGV